MGTKNLNSAADLITFTRASGGTALRKISYGSELVTNGTFDSDSDWTKGTGWTIDSGVATHSGTVASNLRQSPFTVGKTYQVSWEQTGGQYVAVYGNSLATLLKNTNSDGIHKITFTPTSTNVLDFRTNSDGANIDNVSVKEVTFDQPDGTLQLFNSPANVPRIEYNADGTVKGLLIEEARTNLLSYSEDFSNGAWATPYLTVGTGVTAPDGTTASSRLTVSTNSSTHLYPSARSSTIGVTYSTSVFVKANTHNIVQLNVPSTSSIFVNFNLTTGAKGTENNCTASIQSVGDGWYKCSITWVSTSTSNSFGFSIVNNITSGRTTPTIAGYSVYIYGAQTEAGAFPTSYIPTTGATATRAADVASIPTANFGYNSDAGTVLVDAQSSSGNINSMVASLEAVGDNRIEVRFNGSLNTNARGTIVSNGAVQASLEITGLNEQRKIAFAFTSNDFALSANGSAVLSDTSGTLPTVTKMDIGEATYNNSHLNGHIKSIKYYPRRLSNTQLQELTT